jgi:hypothetical protein
MAVAASSTDYAGCRGPSAALLCCFGRPQERHPRGRRHHQHLQHQERRISMVYRPEKILREEFGQGTHFAMDELLERLGYIIKLTEREEDATNNKEIPLPKLRQKFKTVKDSRNYPGESKRYRRVNIGK